MLELWLVMLGGGGNAIWKCQLLSLGIFYRLMDTFLCDWALQWSPVWCAAIFPFSTYFLVVRVVNIEQEWDKELTSTDLGWNCSGKYSTESVIAVLPSLLFFGLWLLVVTIEVCHCSSMSHYIGPLICFLSTKLRHTVAVEFSQVVQLCHCLF